MACIARRTLLGGVASAMLLSSVPLRAKTSTIVISKDRNCGCCSVWAEHVRAAGFTTQIYELGDLAPLKTRLGIPPALASCHTAELEGYVLEGHVPPSLIHRLLAERPSAIGLAVPGMPVGSPGMEAPGGLDETYNIILFSRSVQRVYARFKGSREVSHL